jgi:hypothetical protein
VGCGHKRGVGRVGMWLGEARRGRVHDTVCEREVREAEGADRWGPWASERELVYERSALIGRTHRTVRWEGCTSEGKLAPIGWPHRTERERVRARGHDWR